MHLKKPHCSKLIIIVFFLIPGIVKSQIPRQFAFGISGGYGINSGCFFIDYNILKKLTVTSEFSTDRYEGFGIGLSTTYYPISGTKIKPLISVSYTRTAGSRWSYERSNDVFTEFNTLGANYLTPMVGARYDGFGEDTVKGVFFSIVLKVGYKISNLNYPGASYVSGPPYPDKLHDINSYINNSVVASLGLIYNIGNKHKR